MIPDQKQTETVSEAIKIFLCHSFDDKAAVRNLYQRLVDDGFRPWLDETDLLPGQDWEHEISRAVLDSDAVIICLSRNSVTKRGFVQKEIRRALEIAAEQPLGSIFLIPLRLEPCDIPDQLGTWQWVDYFQPDGYKKLKRTLELSRNSKAGADLRLKSDSGAKHSPERAFTVSTKSISSSHVILFALISLVSFLLGAILLFFMVWKAEKLVALGLAGRLYYIVLLPLGLSVAGFLFGVLQSYASYRGRQIAGSLTLGGPIVAFLATVLLGFGIVPDLSTFPFTVYVHGPAGQQDIVLKNSGEVWMDLGGERKRVGIGDAGQAYFPAIPANFRAQEVPVFVSSNKFESVQSKIKLEASSTYLAVRRKAGHIYGRVETDQPSCLSGAQVVVDGLSTSVDPASGYFDIIIPGDRLHDDLTLRATAKGCISDSYNVVPNSNALTISIRKESLPAIAPKGPRTRSPVSSAEPCKQAKQTSTGPGSPNLQCVQGDVNITIDQSAKEARKP